VGERLWGVAEELRRAPSRLTDDGCLADRFEHVVALSIGLGVDRLVHRRWGTHLLIAPSRTPRVAGNVDLRPRRDVVVSRRRVRLVLTADQVTLI
jgi:hypothetical protein